MSNRSGTSGLTSGLMMGTCLTIATGLTLVLGAPTLAQDKAPKDTILILDASGSMWGQIDGINKIVIAKDTVESLVRGLPAEQRLGMVAYGHRKEGDCSDIETLADVGADRDTVIKQIRNLSPKGKTPLTKSVQHSAEALNYTKNAANIILVSDGLETCEADPCALARTLEENGLDFTVHVVGFDVTEEERKGLVCIAEETGGQFMSADNAEQLTEALTHVAMAEIEAGEPTGVPQVVSLKATILKGGPDIQKDLNWTVVSNETGETVFEAENAGYVDFEVTPGTYRATAVWTGWPHDNDRYSSDKTGQAEFVIDTAPTVVTVPIDLDIPFGLEADQSVAEGQPVTVTWFGPDDLSTTISTNALDDSPRRSIYFSPGQRARDAYEKAATADGIDIDTNGDGTFDQSDEAQTRIGGPTISGEYEVRYTLNEPRVILARLPLTVTDTDYMLAAPDTVAAASEFSVDWTGPYNRDDFLTIIEKDSEDVFRRGFTSRTVEGEAVTMTAPAEPGDYEIRYILTNGYTLYPGMQRVVQASIPIKVEDIGASITAPERAVGGSTIRIEIDTPGDDWADDTVSVIEPGAVKTNADARYALYRVQTDTGAFDIRVPAIAGDYEIAYFLNPGSRVLTRQPITITQAEADVSAPDTVKMGTAFSVAYSGDAFSGDRIIICPADTPDNKMWQWGANYGFFVQDGETSGLISETKAARIFKTPGAYEVRYISGTQNVVLARDAFTVTE